MSLNVRLTEGRNADQRATPLIGVSQANTPK